jgi:hypothetical protein
MDALIPYFLHFASFLFLSSPVYQTAAMNEWPQPEELKTDTLELHLAGPSYTVNFFRDGIIFLGSGYDGLGLVPLDQPVLARRTPLFQNDQNGYIPAGLAFNRDEHACYVTRKMDTQEGIRLEKIFEIAIDSGRTSGTKQMDFTIDSSRYLHPALSGNDSMMVFASDRLPTSGGLDLYVSRFDSSGWSAPLNLGPSVNSPGHECYPFLDRENNLWFSSTGHSGYGRYDLFVCPFNGTDWDRPRNLGPSVNGTGDELGFSIHRDGQAALYSRRSPSGGMALRMQTGESAGSQTGTGIASGHDISWFLLQQSEPPSSPPATSPVSEPEPLAQADSPVTVPAGEGGDVGITPRKVIFRVQILSSGNPGSTPMVVIDGKTYQTFEYHYKGAYRITVGEFETVEDANSFRLQCRRAGYQQAFVAAFRGGIRDTDPSLFQN